MLMRVFLLLTLIGHVGPSAADSGEKKYGGKVAVGILGIALVGGVIALAALLIYSVMSLSGSFSNDLVDPLY